jgi:hypothetical protein
VTIGALRSSMQARVSFHSSIYKTTSANIVVQQ